MEILLDSCGQLVIRCMHTILITFSMPLLMGQNNKFGVFGVKTSQQFCLDGDGAVSYDNYDFRFPKVRLLLVPLLE